MRVFDRTLASQISYCVLQLCDEYFLSNHLEPSLVVVNVVGFTRAQIILKAFNEEPDHEMILLVKDYEKAHADTSNLKIKAKNYVLMLVEPAELSTIIKRMKLLPSWNPLAKFVVLFTKHLESDDEGHNHTGIVLNILLENQVLDAYVMYTIRKDQNVLIVKTWFPFEGNACGQKVENIRLVNTCEIMKPENLDPRASTNFTLSNSRQQVFVDTERVIAVYHFFTSLYPKLPEHYHKCLLRITAYPKEPFVVAENRIIKKGLDVYMVEVMAKKLGLIPVFQTIKNPSGEYSTNQTNGFYSELFTK